MKPKNFFKKFLPFLYSNTTYLAFGIEEAPTKFPLSKSRYLRMASYIHEEYLRQGRPVKVLDIGCNDGAIIFYCKKSTPVEFYGIDVLPEKRDLCLKRGYRSVLLEDIRECAFDYPENFFDVVICSHILEHLEEPEALLKTLGKVMRKDSLLLVASPSGPLICMLWRRHVTPLYSQASRKEESLKRFGHVSFFTLSDLKKLLTKSDFKIEEVRGDYFIRARSFFIENYQWWFNFNQWCGKIAPIICGQVTLKNRIQKAAASPGISIQDTLSEKTPVEI